MATISAREIRNVTFPDCWASTDAVMCVPSMRNGGSAAGRLPIVWPVPRTDNGAFGGLGTQGTGADTLTGMETAAALQRPRWRGRLHQAAFFVSVPAGLWLVTLGSTAASKVGTGVYAVVLAAVWGGAALGVVVRIASARFGFLQGTLYIVLGWIGAIVLPWAIGNLGVVGTSLMFAGGLSYTVGAVLFWLRRPALRPEVFGYHEVWHVLVVAGSLCHYGLILYLVLRV